MPARTTTPTQLSRATILDGALELVELRGADALSMRRLAQHLGVGTMTLYGYFRDKRELVDAMVDAVAARAPVPALRGGWRARLTQLMTHLHRGLTAYPALAELRVVQPIATPGAFRFTEAGLVVLRDAGFDARSAAHHFRTLFVYTFGVAVFSSPARADAERGRVAAALGSLPPEEFPTLTGQLAEMLETLDAEAQFEHGLELILDGVQASLRRGR